MQSSADSDAGSNAGDGRGSNNVDGKYVSTYEDDTGESACEIMYEGMLRPDNMDILTFTPAEPVDLRKKSDESNRRQVDKPADGKPAFSTEKRTYHSSVSVIYSDNTKSANVCMSDCIIAYRDEPKAGYYTQYVSLGIPAVYMKKLVRDCSVAMKVNDLSRENDGYCWVFGNTEKSLKDGGVTMLFNDANGTLSKFTVTIQGIMGETKSNLLVDATLSIGLNHTTPDLNELARPRDAEYKFNFKVTELVVKSETKLGPPPFNRVGRAIEGMELHASAIASDALIAKAMAKLGLKR